MTEVDPRSRLTSRWADRDPTFHRMLQAIRAGGQPIDWRVTGPLTVVQSDGRARRGIDHDGELIVMPAVAERPVQLNLMPEVAAALLRYLAQIAEPSPSRSGKSNTYRMKKTPAVDAAEARSNQND